MATTEHPRRTLRTAARRAATATATAAAAVAVLAGTGGCGISEFVSHEKTEHFDARSDAPTRGDLAFVLPSTVPQDATDITVRVATRDPAKRMYDWRSAGAPAPTGCSPQDGRDVPAPFDDSAGWPEEVATSPGRLCGALHVTDLDGRSYAWLVPADGATGPTPG